MLLGERSRALACFAITAGGDFHPALRTNASPQREAALFEIAGGGIASSSGRP
jgi:hypothetical protein